MSSSTNFYFSYLKQKSKQFDLKAHSVSSSHRDAHMDTELRVNEPLFYQTLNVHQLHTISLKSIIIHILVLFQLFRWQRGSVPGASLTVLSKPGLWEPVGDGHGNTDEAQVDAMYLGGDRDVREEGMIPAWQGRAVAALKVSDHVQDLLALCLSYHPPHI